MYTDGSSALKTEYSITDFSKKKKSAKAKSVSKSAVKPSRKKVVAIKKRIVGAILAAFVMAFIILVRYATITAEYNQLSKLKEEHELLSSKVVATQVKAEGNLDPKKIEQEAERLGLRPPAKSQIEYISLGNTDNGEVLQVEESSSWNAFINRISVILEYLY